MNVCSKEKSGEPLLDFIFISYQKKHSSFSSVLFYTIQKRTSYDYINHTSTVNIKSQSIANSSWLMVSHLFLEVRVGFFETSERRGLYVFVSNKK